MMMMMNLGTCSIYVVKNFSFACIEMHPQSAVSEILASVFIKHAHNGRRFGSQLITSCE
jgi:hypothetical protein